MESFRYRHQQEAFSYVRAWQMAQNIQPGMNPLTCWAWVVPLTCWSEPDALYLCPKKGIKDTRSFFFEKKKKKRLETKIVTMVWVLKLIKYGLDAYPICNVGLQSKGWKNLWDWAFWGPYEILCSPPSHDCLRLFLELISSSCNKANLKTYVSG